MPKITPFLWFDGCAEAAAEFYVATFGDAAITELRRAPPGGPWPEGGAMSVNFRLRDQHLVAFNGGDRFRFTEAISLFVECDTQEEVNKLWERLTVGGTPGRCGWLKDKFGLSWQIVPKGMGELLSDPDRARANRAMQAMMQMGKLDIAALRRAHAGGAGS